MPESALQRYVLDGGVMMFFLVPMALLMIAFTVQGFINLRRARVSPPDFVRRLAALLEDHPRRTDFEAALDAEGHTHARVLRRVLRHFDLKPDADPSDALRESIEEECIALQQENNQLAVVYTVSPLMGLLGTVFGMIRTFGYFAQSADPSVRELGAGINIALLTTAWGLGIAIPAYIFLTIFNRRIQRYEQVVLPAEAGRGLEMMQGRLHQSATDGKDED